MTTQCEDSGLYCDVNGFIELEGSLTKMYKCGDGWYGLQTSDPSSIIHLLFPLTKESVSTNHYNEHNYGGRGTIQTVETFETFISLSITNERSSHAISIYYLYYIRPFSTCTVVCVLCSDNI